MRPTTTGLHELPLRGSTRHSRAGRVPLAAVVIGTILAAAGATPTFAASPYTVSVSPSTVTAGASGKTLKFTFRTTANSTNGRVAIRIPAVASGSPWTAPQRTNARRPGYVGVARGTCRAVSFASISGTRPGPWTIRVDARCTKGQWFAVAYGARASVKVATLAGEYTFATSQTASRPIVTVQPAAAARIELSGTADGTAGGNRNVLIVPRDAYGNMATGYRGTVRFTGSGDASCWTLPTNQTFNSGEVWRKTYRVTCSGPRTLTATDTVTPQVKGSHSFTIAAGPAHSIGASNLQVGGTLIPGQAIDISMNVVARDVFDNVATTENGPASLSIGGFDYEPIDPPAEVTLVNGVASVVFVGYVLNTHVQVSAGVTRDGLIGTGSVIDITGIPTEPRRRPDQRDAECRRRELRHAPPPSTGGP